MEVMRIRVFCKNESQKSQLKQIGGGLDPGRMLDQGPRIDNRFKIALRELREIVPDGTNCSIDLLLERTIKHVLFLQSVMKHADGLKHSCESKIMENLELVDHIKILFSTLQNVPEAFLYNSMKDPLIGMIKGPALQAMPMLPISSGSSPTLEGKPVASLTGKFIRPFLTNESSIMPDKSNGPLVVTDFSSLKNPTMVIVFVQF